MVGLLSASFINGRIEVANCLVRLEIWSSEIRTNAIHRLQRLLIVSLDIVRFVTLRARLHQYSLLARRSTVRDIGDAAGVRADSRLIEVLLRLDLFLKLIRLAVPAGGVGSLGAALAV